MILILGMGKTGLSVAKFLHNKNKKFIAADSRHNPPFLKDFKQKFASNKYFLGSWKKTILDNIDLIIISPGISHNESIVILARQKNIPIIGDVGLFFKYVRKPVIGITGTNGKSTVTALVADIAKGQGLKTKVGGNIGTPCLELLKGEADIYILELSSYQLDTAKNLKLELAVVLNISPDHMDRYPDYQTYIKSKLSIYKNCNKAVINLDEPLVKNINKDNYYFGFSIANNSKDFGTVVCHNMRYLINGDKPLMEVSKLKIIGEHNIKNALAALCIGSALNFDMDKMLITLQNFKGLKHRLQYLGKKNDIDFYNDSKSTTVISTITALKAVSQKTNSIILIAGGRDKGEDYKQLADNIKKYTKAVILIGETAHNIGVRLKGFNTYYALTMKDAITQAIKNAKANYAILLSPACASFDMYDDFNVRGDDFIKKAGFSIKLH